MMCVLYIYIPNIFLNVHNAYACHTVYVKCMEFPNVQSVCWCLGPRWKGCQNIEKDNKVVSKFDKVEDEMGVW